MFMTGKKLFAMLLITISVFVVAATGHAEDRKPLTSVQVGVSASPGDFSDAFLFGESGKLSEKEVLPPAYSARIDRILTLVRTRSDDPRVLGQIRHKLLAISGERLLMISSLSDRITAQAGETGNDVAYLLMTTLIILS
jgi:hypothetical protein